MNLPFSSTVEPRAAAIPALVPGTRLSARLTVMRKLVFPAAAGTSSAHSESASLISGKSLSAMTATLRATERECMPNTFFSLSTISLSSSGAKSSA